jgi:hypothetical protein
MLQVYSLACDSTLEAKYVYKDVIKHGNHDDNTEQRVKPDGEIGGQENLSISWDFVTVESNSTTIHN